MRVNPNSFTPSPASFPSPLLAAALLVLLAVCRVSAVWAQATFTDTLRSGGEGPEMVVIPAGSFRMGCLNDDGDCDPDEFPVHRVTVPSFALGKYEVTFAEWDACVAAGGCDGYRPPNDPNREGWGRGSRPVINVSWYDAQSYVAWLSAQTGEAYRLPSEAELEYAARAGTETKYHWGDAIGVNRANCNGCGSQWDNRQTAPVGSFAPNAWGLYDMHGNAMEWTEDCWNNSYTGAPNDGSAWESGDCSHRALYGGSWNNTPKALRAAQRYLGRANSRTSLSGFRIVRSASSTTTPPPPSFGGGRIADQRYTQNTAISALTLPAAIGGTGSLTYRLSPALPAGLRFDARTRRLTGTPTATWTARVYTYTVTDANGATDSLTFRLRVAESPPFGVLENPSPNSAQSGVGIISGWACEADRIEIQFNHEPPQAAAYGTSRPDTQGVCGDSDNGFGLLFNWNLLGEGRHTVRALLDGAEFARTQVTVTTFDEEFLRGVQGSVRVPNFPRRGESRTLVWQQSQQNFVITAGQSRQGGGTSGSPPRVLENPGPNSYQSGVGVISGWVCDAEQVELIIGDLSPQRAGYGTERLDTAGVCGDTNNGFGLLFNWNRLDDGVHTVRALADGREFAQVTVQVTTLGEEFARGLSREVTVADFPEVGVETTLVWQQAKQNFVITGVTTGDADYDGDGIPDQFDPDDDNDGVADTEDAFPFDPTEWADNDGDGIGNNADTTDGTDPSGTVTVTGRVSVGGPVDGANVLLTALNGVPIAATSTSSTGDFALRLGASALPDPFLVIASGGQVQGENGETVEMGGAVHAYLPKQVPARVNITPLTEIIYQEVRLRFPQGTFPSGSGAAEVLDELAAKHLVSGRTYTDLLAVDPSVHPSRLRLRADLIRRGLTQAILAGAGRNEIANRVAALLAHFASAGVEGDDFGLQKIEGAGDERTVTTIRPDEERAVGSLQQTFIDRTGAVVVARLTRVNDEQSQVEVDINHGGNNLEISGVSDLLGEIDYTEASLARLVDRIVTLSGGDTEDSLLVQIDKGLSQAISDGELLFRINGREPTSEELSVIRDDPEIRWNFQVASLEPEIEDHGVENLIESVLAVRTLTTDDLLIFQILRKEDYERLTGFDSEAVKKEFWKDVFQTGIVQIVTTLLGVGWISNVTTAVDVVRKIERLPELGEAFLESSRVNVNTTGTHAADRIVPGATYGLDLFFEFPAGDNISCRRNYTQEDLRRSRSDLSYRRDEGCQGDVKLRIDQTDKFVYEGPPLASDTLFTFPQFSSRLACWATSIDLIEGIADVCTRTETRYDSKQVGQLNDLEAGYYWIIPRQRVTFQPYNRAPREGETIREASMTLELELVNKPLVYDRALTYPVVLEGRDIFPEFQISPSKDGRSLVLDARASTVEESLDPRRIRYTWSHEQSDWTHTTSSDLYAVSLETLGVSAPSDSTPTDTLITITLTVSVGDARESRTKTLTINPWFGEIDDPSTFTPGVELSPTTLTVSENGGTGRYTVVLTGRPDGTVTVSPTTTSGAIQISGALTFTPSNWDVARTVTVTGVDDTIDNPGDRRTATIRHHIRGGGYDGVRVDSVTVTVTDDDGAEPPDVTGEGAKCIECVQTGGSWQRACPEKLLCISAIRRRAS